MLRELEKKKDFAKFQALRKGQDTHRHDIQNINMSDSKSSLKENPKSFWRFVKGKTKSSFTPGFLKLCG